MSEWSSVKSTRTFIPLTAFCGKCPIVVAVDAISVVYDTRKMDRAERNPAAILVDGIYIEVIETVADIKKMLFEAAA